MRCTGVALTICSKVTLARADCRHSIVDHVPGCAPILAGGQWLNPLAGPRGKLPLGVAGPVRVAIAAQCARYSDHANSVFECSTEVTEAVDHSQ